VLFFLFLKRDLGLGRVFLSIQLFVSIMFVFVIVHPVSPDKILIFTGAKITSDLCID
jgi:hypothetical protein